MQAGCEVHDGKRSLVLEHKVHHDGRLSVRKFKDQRGDNFRLESLLMVIGRVK